MMRHPQVNVAGRFDSYTNRLLQTSVEHFDFSTFVIQPSLTEQLARLIVGHGNLLVARMKIATYNHHRSASFFRASVVCATKFTRS
jgi:hypothetical protein